MGAATRRCAAVGLIGILLVAAGTSELVAAEEAAAADERVGFDALPWAFRPLKEPATAQVNNAAWPRQDLDRFILTKLEAEGLIPNPDADRFTLLRRLAFDLTGLPPTKKEIASFVDDPAGDDEAIERVVDHYLASPHFGERWARHWLDVARYADSTGRAWNAPFTYAWRYRNWVIDAFNSDLPYDRFITEQLAGDLLPADTVDQRRQQLIATGFLAIGAHDLQSLNYEQFRFDVIDDQIDVTTRAVLGLSISCARCHDHKYDPVTMRDYYALAGIFQGAQLLPGVAHQRESGGEGYVHPSRLLALPSLHDTAGPWPASDVRSSGRSLPPGVHSMSDYQDLWRSGERDIHFTTVDNMAMGVLEGEPDDCAIRLRGEPWDLGEVVPRGDWRIPGLPSGPRVPQQASGRLELARWLTSDEQPLTPRVMANRIWQHLFGAGIVRTVDDFGVNSEGPTNSELLDHLAWRFRQDDWSIKRLIRTMVLSRAYRMSSAAHPAGQEKDPANALVWRMNVRRLEFEPLRDALLDAAGRLSLDEPHGIQIAGIGGKNSRSQARSLLPISSPYRTVYLPVIRAKLPDEFTTFDFPDPCLLQGQRDVTTVAPQALFFLNSPFVLECASDMASLLLESAAESDHERVEWMYRRLLGRSAAREEVASAVAFVEDLRPSADEADPERYRWAVLIQGLLASAEFRYLR